MTERPQSAREKLGTRAPLRSDLVGLRGALRQETLQEVSLENCNKGKSANGRDAKRIYRRIRLRRLEAGLGKDRGRR